MFSRLLAFVEEDIDAAVRGGKWMKPQMDASF
jgi:hypothetical protein